MIDEEDEGSSMARNGSEARRDQAAHQRRERAPTEDHEGGDGAKSSGEGSGMQRSPAGTRRTAQADQRKQERDMGGDRTTVSSAGKSHSVEAEHVIGDTDTVRSPGAEGTSDGASSKANRKEAGEPEREEAEQNVMGRHPREPAHKNVMGHGERETIAKNTI